MRIVYCTWTDPLNKRSWSGIHYYILKTLQKRFDDIVVVGPLKNKYIFIARILDKLMTILFKKNSTYLHSSIISKEYAYHLSKKLESVEADVLFFPGGSGIIAYLKTNTPIVYLTDSTYESMIDYYQSFSNLFLLSRKMGNYAESNALNKAETVIFASEWAKKEAMEDYNCPSDKISVIPFGANLDKVPERERILELRKKNFTVLKMLLIGVSWERKGCQIAFDTMCRLNERGIETELTICGCKPPQKLVHEHLHMVDFLDKNNPEDARKLIELYEDANIFIFPTRNECAGIVLCEACSYGLPVITTDTGGVSTYIKNGINGYNLPAEAGPDSYADIIESIISDKDRYYNLSVSARERFDNELNWDAWAARFENLIKDKFSTAFSPLTLDPPESKNTELLNGRNNIFLISQPRSGSTLFQKLLHNHHEIATTGEPWALLPILYGNILKNIRLNNNLDFDGPLAEKAIRYSIAELSNPDKTVKEVFLKAYIEICAKHAYEQNAKYFLDKTPRYYYIIDKILEHFPSAKILLLIRNPLSVLSSILNTWVENDYFLLTNYKDDLLLAPKILSETLIKNHPRIFPVHYEQLVKNPSDQLKNICRFLDIDFKESLLNLTNEKKWVFGDQINVYNQNQIVPNDRKMQLKIKNRRDWRLHSDYLDYLGPDIMKSLGYDFEKYRLILDETKPKVSLSLGLECYTHNRFKFVGNFETGKRRMKNMISDFYKNFSSAEDEKN